MMKQLKYSILALLALVMAPACTQVESSSISSTDTTSSSVSSMPELSINEVSGLDDITWSRNEYFDPLRGVMITNDQNEDITHHLHVTGDISYGEVGTYTLTYHMTYGDDILSEERVISIVDQPILRTGTTRTAISTPFDSYGQGIYRTGSAPDMVHPTAPRWINPDLLDKAIPSNSWWTSLLVANYGGSNGIYTNPLRSSFSNTGVEITNPGNGFVQYWNPEGLMTMANFSLTLSDMHMKASTLNEGYETYVVDYSDASVQVATRNVGSPIDQMVVTYTQGSPYIFAEFANPLSPTFLLSSGGIDNYEFYTLNGQLIQGTSYQGNALVVKLVHKHVGYETTPPANVGQPIFADRYFLMNAPENTNFSFSSQNHPSNLLNKINLQLGSGNYLSVAALNNLEEAPYFHAHGYTKAMDTDISYTVDKVASIVETTYQQSSVDFASSTFTEPLQYLMPHHYQHSDQLVTNYSFSTVRGELKLMEGSAFTTKQNFYGLIPALTAPTNEAFDETAMATYLHLLDEQTEIGDLSNFLNDEGPYWNGKALYPLAQGLISADQLGETTLKTSFIAKLRYLLGDWFTYQQDERYLYYNETWGSVYYSNNDFNTASELSDHAFTHGYLVYAASVLAMYDTSFVSDYGGMVELLLNDYLTYEKDAYSFAYLRSFDAWAGHTWAHGFGTFAEGNNLESSSEAIQSWQAGYLWALQSGDEDLLDAAIYGFVHEMESAKTYMFDYSQTIFPTKYSDYADVAGMIWGGKYDYATWFGANPTFIYGIQWLPNGEYLSNYALTDVERARLSDIYATYLKAKNQTVDTWFASMWSIQALINPEIAVSQLDADLILEDDYPSDLAQTYYLIHGLASLGQRTTDYHMIIHTHVSSSIYVDSLGVVRAQVWNPSTVTQTVQFKDESGQITSYPVDAQSFTSIILN